MAKPAPARTSLFALLAAACIAGIFTGTFFVVLKNDYAPYVGSKFAFQGVVIEDPSIKGGKVSLVVQPAAGAFGTGSGTTEKILVTGFSNQAFAYGDVLYVTGKIVEPQPSKDFDYMSYLAAKGIFAEVSYPTAEFVVGSAPPSRVVAWCLALKHALFRRIAKLLSTSNASLIESVLTGDRSGM